MYGSRFEPIKYLKRFLHPVVWFNVSLYFPPKGGSANLYGGNISKTFVGRGTAGGGFLMSA